MTSSKRWGKDAWGKAPWGGRASAFVPPVVPTVPGIGWGLEQFGVDAYGSATALASLTLKSAVAISTHEVRVVLSAAAQAIVATLAGDALNPHTWTVQRLDNNAFLHVVAVREEIPTQFVLTTIERFGPVTVTHRVSSATLLDVNGSLSQQPNKADFAGLLAVVDSRPELQIADRRVVATDIANPHSPSQASGVLGGTLRVTSGGDYASVTGKELVKKLIIRRYISKPGQFFHLPNYGLGLPEKEIVPVADLVKLKAHAENDALREIEVKDAAVALTLDSDGVLSILGKYKLQDNVGDDLELSIPTPVQVAL